MVDSFCVGGKLISQNFDIGLLWQDLMFYGMQYIDVIGIVTLYYVILNTITLHFYLKLLEQ